MNQVKARKQLAQSYRDGTGWNLGMGLPHNASVYQEKLMKDISPNKTKQQVQTPGRSASLVGHYAKKTNDLLLSQKESGNLESKLQNGLMSFDEKTKCLYEGYQKLYDIERKRIEASNKKANMDDKFNNAVQNYRSKTLTSENRKALRQQVAEKSEKQRTGAAVDRALDAQMMEILAANDGLVMPHPAITFVPEYEVQRRKKEQQRMLSATLAEAILDKHKSKSKERQKDIAQANETAQKALISIEKEQKEVEKKKLQDKVKLMQSWEIDRKIRKLEKKVEKKGDKTYHKIVFGQTEPRTHQTEG